MDKHVLGVLVPSASASTVLKGLDVNGEIFPALLDGLLQGIYFSTQMPLPLEFV